MSCSHVDLRRLMGVALMSVIVAATICARLPAQPAAKPAPPAGVTLLKAEPGDDELRKLLKERYNAASREYAMLDLRKDIDPLATLLEQMLACGRRRAEVALEIYPKPEDQVRTLQRLLDEAKKLEMVIENRFRAGGIAGALPQQVEKARGARLDVEIMLVKAKRKAAPAEAKP